ncbi:MAG: von Willebrand factor type A domain-containing protein [Kiritimatiellae bacterium]|jgi:Ca-activated chloride channel family protein|nr:von Willebrand factor type A domain-containing protein [Kiritimatiellia bacterium]
MKKCEDIQFLLTLYALDNLGGVSKQEVSKHLEECKKCQKEFEEIKQGLTVINDVLKDTSVDDQHLSEERYDAIIRASKIKKSTGLGWITKYRPALGIAASTLVVFGLTWAIVSSMKAPKLMKLEENVGAVSMRGGYEDSLESADEVAMLEDPQAIDVVFDSSVDMQSPDKEFVLDESLLYDDDGVDYSDATAPAYQVEKKVAFKKSALTQNNNRKAKPAKAMSSLPEPTQPNYGYVDADIKGNLKRDNKPQSAAVKEIDAVAITTSPIIQNKTYSSRSRGDRAQLISPESPEPVEIEKKTLAKAEGNSLKNKKNLREENKSDKQVQTSQTVARESLSRRSKEVRKKEVWKDSDSFSSTEGQNKNVSFGVSISGKTTGGLISEQHTELSKSSTADHEQKPIYEMQEAAAVEAGNDKIVLYDNAEKTAEPISYFSRDEAKDGLDKKSLKLASKPEIKNQAEQLQDKSEVLDDFEDAPTDAETETVMTENITPANQPLEGAQYEKMREKEEICEEIEVVSEVLADEKDVGDEIVTRQSMIQATGVNPYVQTVENAFSTFSIDVDTASYNLSRRYMLAGLLPPPEMVRTEEFVNSFDYHYVPAASQTFRIYTDIAPSPFAHGQYMMRIGVKGKRLGREEMKQAVLTFLVDTSGSMKRADRIGLIKQSLKFLLEQLGENDKVAIVQYGTKARLVLEHTEVKNIDTILNAIDSLQCGGATDLEDGMLLAYKVAADGYVNNAENKVLLLSDGVANIGEGIAESILEKIRPYIKQGITCSIYGFGIGNYDDAMLEKLANKGNGIYAYVGNLTDAKQIFSEESASTLNLIASDVKIQVEFSPSIVKQYRQLGYENRLLTQQDFRNDTVDAGEIGSGQAVTALYEMELEENKPMDPWRNSAAGLHSGDVLAIVRVRYKDINTKEIIEIEQKVRTRDIKNSFEGMPVDYRLAVGVAEFAEQLRGSPYANNSFRDISKVIDPVAQELPLDKKVQQLKNFIQYAPGWQSQ